MTNGTALLQPPRRTAADQIFDRLHADIVALRLLPGSKVSESEIAERIGVSRQPVREAFIQLSNLGLLTIRPQKATLVRKISTTELLNARYIRTAVEVEINRSACENATENDWGDFDRNLHAQKEAMQNNDATTFHALDYKFHQLICIAARSEFAFSTISENKSQVDRLCMICLADKKNMLKLVEDHRQIYAALRERNIDSMIQLTRSHLSRLDSSLEFAIQEHSEFFED